MTKPQDNTQDLDINTDAFTEKEQKDIVLMIKEDIAADQEVQDEWIESRKLALQRANAEKPSVLNPEIKKRKWQSDKNLGVSPAIGDTYKSTFQATSWNPDTIHAVATEENDIDNKDNTERFCKWMVGKNEVNLLPEIEDYIANKVDQGFACVEIYRKVWHEWVDRKIPNKSGGFTTKTEKVRFEKAVVENIDNLDDILLPRYGKYIQQLPHAMRILHFLGDDILDMGKKNKDGKSVFMNVDAKMVKKFKMLADPTAKDSIEKMKGEQLDLKDVVDVKFRAMPIDIYRWYGWYTKNGKREKYRFLIEPQTETFLSGKPLRKITKTGKYPLVGGPFDKVPGQLRGKDIHYLIKDAVDAFNDTWNQKSDFQYVTNCPFGFHKISEGYTKSEYKLEPMVSYPVDGNPSEMVYFPNLQRSMAWAEQDIRILWEIIEKRTGAASYFQTTEKNTSGTLGRDMLVAKNSETRFGKWIANFQDEFSEMISMCLNIYQEHIPKGLGQRILGEDGKLLFPNLSVETIRYNADVRIEPDIIAGSKAYEKQLYMWAYQTLSQSIWFNPQINPKGSWLLTRDTMKRQGMSAPERYLPPEPKPELGSSRDVDNIWSRLMQGEVVTPEENWNLPEILTGLYRKAKENYTDLDPEYRPNLDKLMFETQVAYRLFMKKLMEDQMAAQIAQNAIEQGHKVGQPQLPAPNAQPGAIQPQNAPISGQPAELPPNGSMV